MVKSSSASRQARRKVADGGQRSGVVRSLGELTVRARHDYVSRLGRRSGRSEQLGSRFILEERDRTRHGNEFSRISPVVLFRTIRGAIKTALPRESLTFASGSLVTPGIMPLRQSSSRKQAVGSLIYGAASDSTPGQRSTQTAPYTTTHYERLSRTADRRRMR